MPTPIHLLVLIHGMWGHPGHMAELQRIASETYALTLGDSKLEVLVAETNREASTYDGIDWGGERVAKEVLDKVSELEDAGEKVTKLSVTGYSLGGLVARYVVGILLQQGFFDKVQPVNFNTIATPHIGLPRYPSLISSLAQALGPRLLSRTGEQFFCADKWSPNGRPILVVMADPDRIFYQALTKFKHLRIYANAINDLTVPYVTAAIEYEDPFAEYETNGVEITMDEEYPYLIRNHTISDTPPPQPEKVAILSRDWFKSFKFRKPIVPPALELRFPLNILLYTMLPLLIPTILSIVLVKFSLDSRSSRARVKALEKGDTSSSTQRLFHILAELEQDVEGAVVDFIDDPNPTPAYRTPVIKKKEHPILTNHQRRLIGWLNTLPLKKEFAFFPDVRNAHAMVISRDVKRFAAHKHGESVIRHWADSLEI
ncbi:lipid particle protein [Coprinopsis marcescibilis]|uniref:Lipid particle protein n=1 Tax=Coprinopsis marcescibilis TaxID=230819 RepID=A0A5C3LA12_COPMA|nr:lipid particle protein [Coprinopsis marcescibilis]